MIKFDRDFKKLMFIQAAKEWNVSLRTIIEWFKEVKNPKQFNEGWCDPFASAFKQIYPTAEIIVSTDWRRGKGSDQVFASLSKINPNIPRSAIDVHSFIKYNNKFYDYECLTGCVEINQLPFYRRILNEHD